MEKYQDVISKTINVDGNSFFYREFGKKGGTPIVLLHHFTGVLDDWDPAILNGLAEEHFLIAFDNKGIGRTEGETPESIEEMAADATAFIKTLGLDRVDLFGFSMGGFVAQVIASKEPQLVRKIILAGTGPAGGAGMNNLPTTVQACFKRAEDEGVHPKNILFFSDSETGKQTTRHSS